MQRRRAFTLIELLVACAIVAILATVIFVSYSGAKEKSKYNRAKGDLASIKIAIFMLEEDTGRWPGSQVNYISYPGYYPTECDNIMGNASISSDLGSGQKSYNGYPAYAHNPGDEVCLSTKVRPEAISQDEVGLVSPLKASNNQAAADMASWAGPYMEQVPIDPWGHGYILDYDYDLLHTSTDSIVIKSSGTDGWANYDYQRVEVSQGIYIYRGLDDMVLPLCIDNGGKCIKVN